MFQSITCLFSYLWCALAYSLQNSFKITELRFLIVVEHLNIDLLIQTSMRLALWSRTQTGEDTRVVKIVICLEKTKSSAKLVNEFFNSLQFWNILLIYLTFTRLIYEMYYVIGFYKCFEKISSDNGATSSILALL